MKKYAICREEVENLEEKYQACRLELVYHFEKFVLCSMSYKKFLEVRKEITWVYRKFYQNHGVRKGHILGTEELNKLILSFNLPYSVRSEETDVRQKLMIERRSLLF